MDKTVAEGCSDSSILKIHRVLADVILNGINAVKIMTYMNDELVDVDYADPTGGTIWPSEEQTKDFSHF